MAKKNPIVSGYRRAGIARPGAQYLRKPELFEKDLLKANRLALARLAREVTIFLRRYGLSTRGQTMIDQPSYGNKLKAQFKSGKNYESMSPDCHGAILLVDNDTSDLLALVTGKGSGPGLRRLAQYYDNDPAKRVKLKILVKVLRSKFEALLSERGFRWKKPTKLQFQPKDPHHYKSGIYRVLPLWVEDMKATGARLRAKRNNRRRLRRRRGDQ